MFDAFGGEPEEAATATATLDESRAWDKTETLAAEYEALGFYLSGHPLEERAGLVGLLSSAKVPELAHISGGTEVRIAGLVLQKAELMVKSGKMAGRKMCRFRLEDLHGSVSVTVFPRTYEECREIIEDGAVLLCRAKVEDSSEEPALILEEVYPIDQALEHFQGGLQLTLGPEDDGLLTRLLDALGRHKGRSPLFLQVRGTDGAIRRVRAGRQHSVRITEELAVEFTQLLGVGRVSLVRI